MGLQGLLQQLPHRHTGIQGGIGVLKDQLHIPALLPHGLFLQGAQILTIEIDMSGGGFDQPQDRAARGGFAAAGFAHQAECLLLPDLKGDVFYGMDVAHGFSDDSPLNGEVGLEVLHVQDDIVSAHAVSSFGVSAWSQQRHRCPGEISDSAGARLRQMSIQCSQRSAKRQPTLKFPAVGTVPWMV